MNTLKTTAEHAPCFLCGNKVEIRYSKRQKPYLVCNSCGVQVFIRGKNGISRLDNWKIATVNQNNSPDDTAELIQMVDQLEKLKIRLKQTEQKESPWEMLFSDNPAANATKAEIKRIENRLRELANTE